MLVYSKSNSLSGRLFIPFIFIEGLIRSHSTLARIIIRKAWKLTFFSIPVLVFRLNEFCISFFFRADLITEEKPIHLVRHLSPDELDPEKKNLVAIKFFVTHLRINFRYYVSFSFLTFFDPHILNLLTFESHNDFISSYNGKEIN